MACPSHIRSEPPLGQQILDRSEHPTGTTDRVARFGPASVPLALSRCDRLPPGSHTLTASGRRDGLRPGSPAEELYAIPALRRISRELVTARSRPGATPRSNAATVRPVGQAETSMAPPLTPNRRQRPHPQRPSPQRRGRALRTQQISGPTPQARHAGSPWKAGRPDPEHQGPTPFHVNIRHATRASVRLPDATTPAPQHPTRTRSTPPRRDHLAATAGPHSYPHGQRKKSARRAEKPVEPNPRSPNLSPVLPHLAPCRLFRRFAPGP